MCGARLFAVRVILLQRYKVLPAFLPDFGSLPTLTKPSTCLLACLRACNGRPVRAARQAVSIAAVTLLLLQLASGEDP